ncbi:hypothetical protein [Microbacterium sp. Ag1]|uniref:hypothetical protein n=1 Tax=Microbacterium sp. Ag1 TaxID=1643443 RepID=UPI00069C495A|nr:hypothetical protein [Microbacterium sp. Ag1]
MPSSSTSSGAVNGMRMWSSGETDTANAALPAIEALITGAHWARTPSTVALIRSIAVAVGDDPVLRTTRIRDIEPEQAPPMSERIPQLL